MEERPLAGALLHIQPVRSTKNKMNTTLMLFYKTRSSGTSCFEYNTSGFRGKAYVIIAFNISSTILKKSV